MKKTLTTLAAILAMTATAQAHTGHDAVFGFTHGFGHPFGGLDHILAMVAVGLFAAHLGGKARWALPVAFVGLMALAGIAGTTGVELPFIEIGIAASVIVLGALLAFGTKMPVAVAASLVGFFAVFHGFAHGAEMPATGLGIAYGAGFMLATMILHMIGLAAGLATNSVYWRASGAVVSLAGLGLLTGVI